MGETNKIVWSQLVELLLVFGGHGNRADRQGQHFVLIGHSGLRLGSPFREAVRFRLFVMRVKFGVERQ